MSWPDIVLKNVLSERIKIIFSALQNSKRKKLLLFFLYHNLELIKLIPGVTVAIMFCFFEESQKLKKD